jgi:hypothetical protein
MARQILTATLGPDGGAGPLILLAATIAVAGTVVLKVHLLVQAGTKGRMPPSMPT